MSARRLPDRLACHLTTDPSRAGSRFSLPGELVRIRRSGIEFCSERPISLWTELTVGMELGGRAEAFRSAGVVVACRGSRQNGYQIALLFTNLTPRCRAALEFLAAR